MLQQIMSLDGTLEEETDFNFRTLLPECCGLAAAINLPDASATVYNCLLQQQKRGEEGAGIFSAQDGRLFHYKDLGKVGIVFDKFDFGRLPGKTAIGHNRYATKGLACAGENVQPLLFDTKYGPLAIAHNGTIVNANKLREQLKQQGTVFQSTTDSELFAHFISRSSSLTLEGAIQEATTHIETAYSLLILTPEKLIALRDRFGVRPLSVARLGSGHIACSETFAFDQYPDSHYIRDINPGEMVIFERGTDTMRSIQYGSADEHWCVFEGIYFSNPRSMKNAKYHEDFRRELGKQHFSEFAYQADCIVPVLDSGKHAAQGLAKASGISYEEAFQRRHSAPATGSRSFTAPTLEERQRIAYQKLHLRPDLVLGKHVVVVDDSIVRSTTMRIIIQRLRDAGAHYVTACISSPPIVNICPNGMDYQDHRELIAYDHSIEEVRQRIGADQLQYLSLSGLNDVVRRVYGARICSGCFGGKYPINPTP